MRLLKVVSAVPVVTAAVLLTASCSASSGGAKGAQTVAGTPVAAPAASGGVAAQPTLAGQQSIIATTKAEFSCGSGTKCPMKVELYGPRRAQGFVTVKVRLTNMTPAGEGGSLGWQIGSAFAGETGAPGGADAFSGVYLLDRKNSKQYLVARNADGALLASTLLGGVFVQAQQAVELFATFGAPPDDVPAVDVAIPGISVFENVPLS